MSKKLLRYFFVSLYLFTPNTQIWGKEMETTNRPITLFELDRLNYKTYKTLIFDLLVNSRDCQIATEKPLDIHYRYNQTEKKGQRIELSSSSSEYFKERNVEFSSGHKMTFSFKALQEILALYPSLEKILTVESQLIPSEKTSPAKSGPLCQAKAMVKLGNSTIELKKVVMNFKQFLGLNIGIDFVRFVGLDESNREISYCLMGECPDTQRRITLP